MHRQANMVPLLVLVLVLVPLLVLVLVLAQALKFVVERKQR